MQRSAVVLDRHPMWLHAMTSLLQDVGLEVVGTATSIDEAIVLVGQHRPDVLVAGVDDAGQDEDGVLGLRRAREAHPGVKLVVVGEGGEPENVEAAFSAGASIYCVRTAERGDLASAIRQAFQPSIYVAGTEYRGAVAPPVPVSGRGEAVDLTRRELEILQLVAEGHSNSQLAKMLWVTEQTIKFHLSNIYRKLDVSNRTEASRWAQLNGILPATPTPVLEPSAA